MPTGYYTRTKIKDPKIRFWVYVEKLSPTECWYWKAYKDKQGYGQFTINGKTHAAHRFAYELINGPITTNLLVCHNCHHPSCVNPRHLYLGTPKDNSQDMVKAGRSLANQDNPAAKLTISDVLQIRELANNGYSHRALGRLFKVGKTTITNIVNHKTWASLLADPKHHANYSNHHRKK